MLCRQCRKAESFWHSCSQTATDECKSTSATRDEACPRNRLNDSLNLSHPLPEDRDWGYRLFIKSSATMVVQLTSAASKAKGRLLALRYRAGSLKVRSRHLVSRIFDICDSSLVICHSTPQGDEFGEEFGLARQESSPCRKRMSSRNG